ncbi:ATP-binding cassette domain-containing protein [Apibacter sp. B3924]|nr:MULTISPECIES: ABC transporter ATP-binding protein [unclassified Apibacter]MXO25043.1 ATP-binding cassette domain-containing protein [Apibacter sp. B3924]MXO27206.1 ATP-binding cassette domain-containing protein [Apibacter sp. B3813]MXO29019.1 ATP-binding cassette domain-containing protein [Apibacter sp. B3913]MXO31200.1 ATP-binding cassette domain-containing protein [Apibacter sp. B3912]MXP02395.1 ATP-binding cassette domain-containing protein [Apibacter sp. B3918]
MELGSKYPVWFYSTIFIALALAYVSSFRPVVISHAIDVDIIKNKNFSNLYHSLLLIFLLMLTEVVLQFFLVYASNFVAQNVIRSLRIKLYKKLIYFKSSFFDKTPLGVLVTRSVSDIETISTIYTDGILMVLGDILRIIFVVVTMYWINWELATIALFIFPIMTIITRIFQKAIKKAFSEERNQTANQNSFVQERLSGMTIVQVFNQQKKEYKKFFQINQKLEKAYLKTVFYFSLFFPAVDIITGIAIGVMIWYAGYNALTAHNISPGVVIAFTTSYVNMLVRPMRQIADRFNTIQRGIVGAERVFTVLDSNHEISNKGTVKKDIIKGDIIFDHVSFSYVKGESVLKDLSFTVSGGEKVAIVGATGAGKSTIINLLSRFYEISGGHIYIDGTDIKSYELHNLRSHIAVVLQDVFLFNDTILENITFGNKDITLEEVRKAAKEIQIDDFIMSLPNGYGYEVSERGASISLGQRQLISFLRAYLYNPSILVLDEATSSIDTKSEELIQKATDKITKNRTSIIIAHRLATIQNADKIIVLDHGKIVEIGNHNSLLQRKGYYRKLYEAQFSQT